MISRILKHTEDNVRRQQELLIQCRFSARKMKALTQSKKEDPRELKRDNFEIGGNDSKKSKKLDDTELNYDKNIKQETHKRVCVVDIYSKHNMYLTNPKIKINIPLSLQEWLIDDFDAIMQQNKLVKVPSTKSVRSILSDYKKTIKKQEESKDAKSSNELDETINGLIRYFNIMLGSQLLYKFERLQYSELLNLKKDVCDLYGAFHLLRLLEKLDEIIEYAPLAVKPLENLLANVNDLLKYLDKESPKLFKIEDYIIAPPNYIRAAF